MSPWKSRKRRRPAPSHQWLWGGWGQAERWDKDTWVREVTDNWLDLTNDDPPTPSPYSEKTRGRWHLVLGWGRSGRTSFGDKHRAGSQVPVGHELPSNTPLCTAGAPRALVSSAHGAKGGGETEQGAVGSLGRATAHHPPDNLPVA